MPTLVLIRHGQSVWNLENRFTGWWDVDLTRQGEIEAKAAGGLMAEFSDGLAQGLRVEFDVRGVGWVPGQVAWSAAGRIGVAFDRHIDPMLARKPVGQGGQTPVFVKPIFPRQHR